VSGLNHNSESGLTILEALVATAIVGIGFIAIFQMVNFSVQSINTSNERTKASYLSSVIVEDVISEKNSSSPTSSITLKEYLLSNKDANNYSWSLNSCNSFTKLQGTYTNALENKIEKWNNRLSSGRIQCRSTNDTKSLEIFDICNNSAPGNNCTYNNTNIYNGTGLYNKMYFGKVEVNLNNGNKKKYIYFQID
jgi:Tfp pilus assembly protein PilV